MKSLLRVWPIWLLSLSFGLLLARVACSEAASETISARSSYDPRAYDALVNTEVVPHLEFCPIFADPRLLGNLVARGGGLEDALELVDSEIRPSAPWRPDEAASDPLGCDCGDRRLSALFCLAEKTDPTTADRIRRYALMSPLGADLDTVDRWTYESPGRAPPELRMQEGVRRQRLPGGSTAKGYEGDLLYRQGQSRFALVDAAGNEYLLQSASADDAAPTSLTLPRLLDRQARALAGAAIERAQYDLPVRIHDEQDSVQISSLPGVDNRLLVVAHQSRGLKVKLDGTAIDARSRTIFTLEPDQRLQFETSGGRSVTLRLATRRIGQVSALVQSEHGTERTIDADAGADDLVRGLLSGLDRTVVDLAQGFVDCGTDGLPVEGFEVEDVIPLARADIWLTLDEVLQSSATKALRQFAERGPIARTLDLRYQQGFWQSADRLAPPPHLTLTVLDANSGELLALAAYPDPATLRDQLERLAGAPAEPRHLLRRHLQDELQRSPLQLRPHAIGSLFKPLFAWAASVADPSLTDFTVSKRHATGWASDPGRNRLLEQCMISTRMAPDGQSHFARAYSTTSRRGSCGGAGDDGSEDMCLALAVSDTYWFVELAARVLALEHGRPLPARNTPADARDAAYGISDICGPQRYPKRNAPLCASGAPRPVDILPVACPDGTRSPFCRMKDFLGVQLQAIGGANAAVDAPRFLGDLPQLIERIAESPRACCAALGRERWSVGRIFRWMLPMPPQWSSDLLKSCAPDLEIFVEGGGVNYWNDISLVQGLGRLFTGRMDLHPRIINHVQPAGEREPTSVACREPATGRRIVDLCRSSNDARCNVLRGLELALEVGTLNTLRASKTRLSRSGALVELWGKTGTTRAPFPAFFPVRDEDGTVQFERRMAVRKSIFTSLLVEVAQASGRARQFVVLLSIQGAGDRLDARSYLTSVSGAVPFFAPDGPGFSVLEQLVAHAGQGGCEK